MASQVEIINRALTKLGSGRITSINDNNKRAYAMVALWDSVRRAELTKRFWGFAIRRTSLAALGTIPSWGFKTEYQLPNDYLRLIQVNDVYAVPALTDYRSGDDSAYAIENTTTGAVIRTDFNAPLKIRYVADITDPGLFNPLFVEGMATKLAYEVCQDVTDSNTKQQMLAQEYDRVIREAAKANAIEKPPQGIPDDSFMLSRL